MCFGKACCRNPNQSVSRGRASPSLAARVLASLRAARRCTRRLRDGLPPRDRWHRSCAEAGVSGGERGRLSGLAVCLRDPAYLRAGLVDEMHLAYVPVLLGSSERLFTGSITCQADMRLLSPSLRRRPSMSASSGRPEPQEISLGSVLSDAEPGVPRPQDRLGPIGDLELGEDRGQMVGDGFRR
jgi:hypothetical protein